MREGERGCVTRVCQRVCQRVCKRVCDYLHDS